MRLSIPEFIGHLHPVLVHLPIGILLLACLFLWQSRKDHSDNLQKTINIILGLGMASAIASCISGYILSRSGEYDEEMVGWHQWMGISVAVVSIITFYFRRKKSLQRWQSWMASLLLILILITGHLGGSLTHGADYLTAPLTDGVADDTASLTIKPISNVQEALIYGDVIQPILQRKCYSCHGRQKQKGKLRLDDSAFIAKGGKDGPVILAGKADQSELIKRIMLPREDEHHMAPKEKPQLTESERQLIKWWIDQGASYSGKVKDFTATDKVKTGLVALQSAPVVSQTPEELPELPVQKADESTLDTLRKLGAVVLPLSQNSNYLDASFITVRQLRNADLKWLTSISKQLVLLRLSGTAISDSGMSVIAQCTELRQLQLDRTGITDQGLELLTPLHELRMLNLVATKVTAAGLLKLKALKKLRSIYLYQTAVTHKDWKTLQQAFPQALLDSGGYQVPLFANDTVVVKPKPQPN